MAFSTSGAPWPDPVSVKFFLRGAASTPSAASGLSRLHVGGDGASLGETFKALVCVVEEHPVL